MNKYLNNLLSVLATVLSPRNTQSACPQALTEGKTSENKHTTKLPNRDKHDEK